MDAIWLAARVVTDLQQAIARRLNALDPVVISFGKIEGGKAFNVIADQVRLLGTVRCVDLALHDRLPGWIETTVSDLCRSAGGSATVRYRCIAPPVVNDPGLTALRAHGQDLSCRRVQPVHQLAGGGDFAELLRVPGTMMRLGVAGPEGCAPLHNGRFEPDEQALAAGIEVLSATLLAWMRERCGG